MPYLKGERKKKKVFGCTCTPPTDPNLQGWCEDPFFFFFLTNQSKKKKKKRKKKKKKSDFLPKIVFLKMSKLQTYPKKKKLLFLMKYSWQALLLCNKPFDLIKILVWLHFIFWASKPLSTRKKIWPTDHVFYQTQEYNQAIIFFWPYREIITEVFLVSEPWMTVLPSTTLYYVSINFANNSVSIV